MSRKVHEEYQSTCIIDRYSKNNSWMFRGCFAGTQAGPFVFWQRSSKKITSKGYRQHILPEAVEFLRSSFARSGVVMHFMQDNGPIHTAAVVKEYLGEHGIVPMVWPPYSSDLNPIENVWGLESYIQDGYGDSDLGQQRGRAEISSLVEEA